MKSFSEDTLKCISTTNLIGVRGGAKPRKFLEIWMVVVDGRLFARSWSLSEKSWFTAFLNEGCGVIKCGAEEIEVSGRKVENNPELQEKINNAYLTKYDSEHNRPYAIGITQPRHIAATMEFFPIKG